MEKNKPTEKDIISTLFDERDSYQQANQQQRSEINDIYNVYIGKMENVKKIPYKTRESSSKLRTEISYIVPSIFSGQPEIEIEGIGEEDKALAAVYEKIINYRINTIDQFYEKIESWVKQSVTFGTSLIKVNWKFETEEKEEPEMGEDDMEMMDEQGQPVINKYEVPTVDEPELEVPNILDCFYNPILTDVCNQKSIIFRSVLPIGEVKENTLYDFTDEMGNLNREKIAEKGNVQTDRYNSTTQQNADSMDLKKASEGTVEIYERVTEDRIQTVVDGKEQLVLRDSPWDYGYINAVKLTHEPNCVPNRFEGWGVGHNTMGIAKRLYRLENQIEDGVRLTNNPMFIAKKGKGIDPKQAVAKPGGMIFVDVPDGENIQNSIVPIQFPDTKQGAVNLLARVDEDHKRASGANDMVQGAASNKTLGQDQIATSYSSQRFELVQRRFKQALADVANIILKMELKNLQNVNSPILRIFPQELRQDIYDLLTQSDDIKYNIRVKGETNIAKNKDIQIKQLIDLFNLFGPSLPPENQMAWAKKILELRGIDEIDKLIPDLSQQPQAM